MPSRELSVFWRIENFSLLGMFTSVKSALFSLRCGKEAGSGQQFYIEYHPSRALFHPGTLKLSPSRDRAYRPRETRLPQLQVAFYALLVNGECQQFHDKGRILDGLEARDCKGWFKRFSFLLKHRAKYLLDDSLTFLVQFSSDDPVFGAQRLFARTRIPIRKTAYEWEVDLSKGKCRIPVPGLPVVLYLEPAQNNSRGAAYDLCVLPKHFPIYPVLFDAFLKKDSGRCVAVKRYGHATVAGEDFALSKSFCKKHAKEALRNRGRLTLCFEFFADDGEPVPEDFRETPFDVDGDKNKTWRISKPPPKPKRISTAGKEPKAPSAEHNIDSQEYAEDSNSTCSSYVANIKAVAKKTRKKAVKGTEKGASACSANVPEAKVNVTPEKHTDFKASLISSLRNHYSQHIFSDFTLRVGQRFFPVHRDILSTKSAVFRAMFEADMRENCSEVTDVDADTMDRMLRFVYFNEFRDQDVEGAAKLFAAADKYKIESLKPRCVEYLADSLSVENVCFVLSLADKHGDQTLMAKAMEFLLLRADAVFRTEGWKRLILEKLDLACSIMHEKFLQQQPTTKRDGTSTEAKKEMEFKCQNSSRCVAWK